MIELKYNNFYKNGGTFIYSVNERCIQTALRKIMRKYFQISKEDTVVSASKAYWIIDWFLGGPVDEDCSLLSFMVEEFNDELHEFFESEAEHAFEVDKEYQDLTANDIFSARRTN